MQAEKMWKLFTEKYPEYKNETYEAWRFGADPDELARLTVEGLKTATTSGYELYAWEGEPLPQEGEFSVILNSRDNAICIIRTTKVVVLPFQEVPESHAHKEGEGDRTLDYWRRIHQEFFAEEYQAAGLPFREVSSVVCEEFKVVFSEGVSGAF